MKQFQDLVEEVQKPGLCRLCGGCVNFCTAINYGALAFDRTGTPYLKDRDKCIKCGLCYAICPEISELDTELKINFKWTPPMGNYIKILAARSKDPKIRNLATDGGVVTSLLLFLLDRGFIDGAIVSRQKDSLERKPYLAASKKEIMESAGFYMDHSQGMQEFSSKYSTYSSSIDELSPIMQKGFRRVAFVGLPCQINTVRKMEALGIVPTDAIKYYLGLFCSGTLVFGKKEKNILQEMGNFNWDELKKINIKEDFMLHLQNGQTRHIPLNDLDFMKKYACFFCDDYSAEFADISFGGLGAKEGWTTVVTRTTKGRNIYLESQNEFVEEYQDTDRKEHLEQIVEKCRIYSKHKKQQAKSMRQKLGKTRHNKGN